MRYLFANQIENKEKKFINKNQFNKLIFAI